MTLHLPPAENIFAGQPKAVKALDDNELQHAYSIDVVSMVTNRFVLWFPNKSGPEGPLIMFHNLEGSNRAVSELSFEKQAMGT